MLKKINLVKYSLFVLIITLSFLAGILISKGSNSQKLYSKSKFYLGSIVEVKFYCNDERLAERAFNEVFNEFERIDRKYSFYSAESFLSKLNSDERTVIQIDNETYNLLQLCDSVYKLTNRKYDASIGSLTNLWKKYIDKESQNESLLSKVNFMKTDLNVSTAIPDKFEIASAARNSGWSNVKFISKNEIYRSKKVLLNFDAVIQGYAADRAIDILKSLGIYNALVNASGEIKVIGDDWKIGIKHPRLENELIEKVKISNYSIATSGDYEKFIEVNGRRYHHIIDPETGYPSTKNISVTVITKDCALADALATGFFSLNPEEIVQISENLEDVFVFIIDSSKQIHKSKNFEKFIWRY